MLLSAPGDQLHIVIIVHAPGMPAPLNMMDDDDGLLMTLWSYSADCHMI